MPRVRRYRFESFEVDPSSGEIWKDGEKIGLQEKPFQLLLALLEIPGEVVTREQLRTRLWPDHTFVDFDHSINVAVSKLRDVLGDSPEEPLFIQTLPRRGYRFIADVAVRDNPQDSETGAVRDPLPRGWLAAVTLLAITALVLTITLFRLHRASDSHSGAEAIQSIAILPFDMASSDADQQYLADGITQSLITELGKIGELRVISWQSVVRFRGSETPLPEIAYLLDVEAVVLGSIWRVDDRVSLSAQLVAVNPEHHLWAESYEENLGDLLGLQQRIATSVARELLGDLTSDESASLGISAPVDQAAYDAYLRGLYHWNTFSRSGFEQAIEYLETSIALDTEYAAAHSALADAWSMLSYYGHVAPSDGFPRAEASASRALELDENLAAAHSSMAAVLYCYRWDLEGAEKEHLRALELNPGSSLSRNWYSWLLADEGRHEEALQQIRSAQLLDPLSAAVNAVTGLRLYDARRYDRAVRQLLVTLEMYPYFHPALLFLGMAQERTGAFEAAVDSFRQAAEASGGAPIYQAALASGYVSTGRRHDAEAILARLVERSETEYVSAFHIAVVWLALGEVDSAMAWLERAYEERSPWMTRLGVDPRFDSVREDPRFVDLLHRVGIRN